MFAAKTTYSTFADSNTITIENSASILVYRIIFSNRGLFDADNAVISMKNGDTTVMEIILDGLLGTTSNNFYLDIPFIADKGLSFTVALQGAAAGETVDITVLHSHPGA